MTPNSQTKSNARRSAEAATRRTGIKHTIRDVDGGWVVVAQKVVLVRANIRDAARAVLDAWKGGTNSQTNVAAALKRPMAELEAAMTRCARPAARLGPRQDTKQAVVLDLLRRPGGVSAPVIAETTGWAANTVRGFLAGLKKKGLTVNVLDRVRQVDPDKHGARGSYTVYGVTETPPARINSPEMVASPPPAPVRRRI